jgi:hypothetical protein
MNRMRATLTFAVLLLAACVAVADAGKYNEKTVTGTWEFDIVKMMKAAAEAGEVPPGVDIEAMAKNVSIRIKFDKDGSYMFVSNTMGNEKTEKGTWEVVKSEGDAVTVKSVSDDGEEQIVTIVFADADHFDATIKEGDDTSTISAIRVKELKKDEKGK